MTSLATIFSELVAAIEANGRNTTISAPVMAVIDHHDMLLINRGDGDYIETDFGVRRGAASIIGHFFMYPETENAPAHIAYDIDWHGAPAAPGEPDIERRSWEWELRFDDGQLALEFPIHQ